MDRYYRIAPAFLIAFVTSGSFSTAAEGEPLKRVGALGARLGPVSEEIRQERKLPDGVGALIMEVLPNLTAEESGIKPGDIVTAFGEKPVASTAALVAALSTHRAGDKVKIALNRAGETIDLNLTLKPRPQEKSTDEFEVIYDSVTIPAGRLRTIVTRPKPAKNGGAEPKKYPAIMLIQGVGGFSVENGPGGGVYANLIGPLARGGFVTMRIEKPGQGDSEGGPTSEVDFDTELAGYKAGLKALKASDFVDADRIVLFGHSMGGVMAPLMAADEPVKGIAVYGTVVKTWPEYMMANVRRQAELGGESASKIDEDLKKDNAINYHLFVEGKSPKAVSEAHPELASRIADFFPDGEHFVGRSHKFFRQLAARNLASAWEKVDADVLSVWGASDFVSDESDHAMIAAIVERNHPGHAKFVALENSDHGMNRAATQKDSFDGQKSAGEYDARFQKMLLDWAVALTKPKA